VVCQFEVLAHNFLIWVRRWLAPVCPKIARLGLLHMVRDVLQVSGLIILNQALDIQQIVLNPADPLAKELQFGLAALLSQEQVAVILGETKVVSKGYAECTRLLSIVKFAWDVAFVGVGSGADC
jgi:hypothetical protein